jgi:hypothetical protein
MQTKQPNNETATTESQQNLSKDIEYYRFGLPLHMIFALCVAPEGEAVGNGMVLTSDDQKVLSVMFWECAKQNMPDHSLPIIHQALSERWPEVSFGIEVQQ